MFKSRVIWIKIAASHQELEASFPSSGLKKIMLERRTICLIKHKDEFFAVNNKCPHQGASLSEGACTSDGFLVCPWHRYGFDIKNGRGPGYYVDTYPIEIREDGIYLGVKKKWLEL